MKYLECYYCGLNEGKWCKVCQNVFCEVCHEEQEAIYKGEEYLSPHQYYNMEILGVRH